MAIGLIPSSKALALISFSVSLVLTCLTQAQNQSPKSIEPIVLTATVTAAQGTFVGGIKQDDFEVFVDKDPARVLYARREDVPLSIGILFDASASVGTSGSSKGTRAMVKDLQRALKRFMERSNQSNEYFVLGFNTEPQLLHDWSSDSRAITAALEGILPTGNTAFYDACYLAIDKVRHGRYPKRVLLIISDGQDNDSRYFFKQVREALKESNVLVYSMNITNYPGNVGSTLQQDGQEILKQLSAVSGGMSYDRVGGRHLESRDAASVLEIIATELRNQYTIAIEPSGLETEAGKWHKLKLRIAAPDKIKLSTRTREGFYGHHRLD